MEEVTVELKPEGQREPVMQISREREFQAPSKCKCPSAGGGEMGPQLGQSRWGLEDGGKGPRYREGPSLGKSPAVGIR